MEDLSDFKAPYHDQDSIWKLADNFYQLYGKNTVPVDIEDIIEFDLKLEIFPKQNLFSECDSDAYLASNYKTIYVDYAHYFNPKNHSYVRFSLAHEVGHYIIHKDIVPLIKSENPEDWKNIILTFPTKEYKFIEWHAYEFAGRLLVPRENLISELLLEKDNIKTIFDSFPYIFDDEVISKVSIPISKKFNVSPEVIAKRIKIEKVWDLVK